MMSEYIPDMGRKLGLLIYAATFAAILAGCLAEKVEEEGAGSDGEACSTLSFDGFNGVRTPNATWQYIQPNIFAKSGRCTNCHAPPNGAGPSNLSLDSDQYTRVVTEGLQSGFSDVELKIIEPGFKECSFLYRKISEDDDDLAAAGEGSRMPLNLNPLSSADIQLIGDWIDEGASLDGG
jgi:hypothetical protein